MIWDWQKVKWSLERFDLFLRADFRFFRQLTLRQLLSSYIFYPSQMKFFDEKISILSNSCRTNSLLPFSHSWRRRRKKFEWKTFSGKIHHLKSLNECKFIFRVPKNLFTLVIMIRIISLNISHFLMMADWRGAWSLFQPRQHAIFN